MDTPNQYEMSGDLLRQRRNLMLTSLLIIIVHGGGVELGDSLQVVGVKFAVSRPWVLLIVLWAGWAWSLYRYKLFADAEFGPTRGQIKRLTGLSLLRWCSNELPQLDARVTYEGKRLVNPGIDGHGSSVVVGLRFSGRRASIASTVSALGSSVNTRRRYA